MRAQLVQYWRSQDFTVTIIAPENESAISILTAPDFYFNLGMKQKRQRYSILLYFYRLACFFWHNNHFDVILASEIPGAVLAIIKPFIRLKTPLYFTFHNPVRGTGRSFLGRIKAWSMHLMVKVICKTASGIGANSRGVAAEISRISGGERVSVLYNPVIDEKHLEQRPVSQTAALFGNKKILSVGRLHPQKGFVYLIRAFAKIRCDAHLFIVGEGGMRDKLIILAKKCGVAERVHFLGYRNDVLAIMREADCYVLSSRWEGFGNVLVEALYAQLPIVSFDCDYGPREILADGAYGRLVPCFSTDLLARGIEEALDEPRNANERWRDFTVSAVAHRYSEFLGIRSRRSDDGRNALIVGQSTV